MARFSKRTNYKKRQNTKKHRKGGNRIKNTTIPAVSTMVGSMYGGQVAPAPVSPVCILDQDSINNSIKSFADAAYALKQTGESSVSAANVAQSAIDAQKTAALSLQTAVNGLYESIVGLSSNTESINNSLYKKLTGLTYISPPPAA